MQIYFIMFFEPHRAEIIKQKKKTDSRHIENHQPHPLFEIEEKKHNRPAKCYDTILSHTDAGGSSLLPAREVVGRAGAVLGLADGQHGAPPSQRGCGRGSRPSSDGATRPGDDGTTRARQRVDQVVAGIDRLS
jgi:hypothetical protein